MKSVMVLLVLVGPAFAAAGADRSQRLTMVLPFRGDEANLAARFTDRLTLKLARQVRRIGDQTDLKVLSKIEVDEAWGQGDGPKLETPPQEIAKWLRQVAAHVAIWGTVDRQGKELAVIVLGHSAHDVGIGVEARGLRFKVEGLVSLPILELAVYLDV